MTPPDICTIEQQLREAVSAGDFAAVPCLLDSYCRAVEVQATQIGPGDPGLVELFAGFQSTADWIRLMASAARARLADDLHKAELVQGYLSDRRGTRPPLSLAL